MAKFKYVGDADEVTCWGITFPRGEAVEVDGEMEISKLTNNSHFEQVKRGRPKVVDHGEDGA